MATGSNGGYTESVVAGPWHRQRWAAPRTPPFDVDALPQGFGRLVAVEFDAVGGAVGAAVGMPEIQLLGADRLAQVGETVAVGVGVDVAGEAVGGAVHLDGVADEHAVLPFDDVGDRPRGVAGDRVHGDLDAAAEREGLPAAHEHRRFHLPRDDRFGGRGDVGGALGVVQVLPAAGEVVVDVGLPCAQQRGVGLVDDDLGCAAGGLPQGVGAADVVDVPVGEQDPPHVLEPPAQLLQCGGHALGRGRGDAGVDDRGLLGVDEEGVEPEPSPRGDDRMDRHVTHACRPA